MASRELESSRVWVSVALTTFRYGGIGWSHENTDNSVGWVCPTLMYNEFVDPPRYSSKDIICNTGNTPGPKHAPVQAGSTVTMKWSDWPDHHRGPMLTYLADCKGSCKDVDPSKLEFFKIAEAGMSQDIPSDQPSTGHWPTDDLRANGMQYDVVIPKGIADSNYVIRHEIIALQETQRSGAQHYARCFNLEVTGGGSDRPAGVVGTALYKASDPGLTVDITQAQPNGYPIPGPPLYNGGSSSTLSSRDPPTSSKTSYTSTPVPTASEMPKADGGNGGPDSASTQTPSNGETSKADGDKANSDSPGTSVNAQVQPNSQTAGNGNGYSDSPSTNTLAESQNQEVEGSKDNSESPTTSTEAKPDEKSQEEGNGEGKPESGEGEQSTSSTLR